MKINVKDFLQGRYIVIYPTINDSYDIAFLAGFGPIGARQAQEFVQNSRNKQLYKDLKIVIGGSDELEYI